MGALVAVFNTMGFRLTAGPFCLAVLTGGFFAVHGVASG
ncbi:hypothetical protein SAMN04489717_5555 [Actinopolymorpha singaporensis]|uniref:Uncharacterized protein n=1 Tax=Actinopolymorpha singaporensis TaxID=117157 RepID=A0A1H1YLA7_9ACTN|nr:hypothetical protein SAMN04489717_5555 [Actinopolymorpha singaporensis]